MQGTFERVAVYEYYEAILSQSAGCWIQTKGNLICC